MHLFHFIKRFSAVILTLLLTAVFLGRMSVTVKAYTFTPDITLHSSAAILIRYSMKKMLISSKCRDIWHRL